MQAFCIYQLKPVNGAWPVAVVGSHDQDQTYLLRRNVSYGSDCKNKAADINIKNGLFLPQKWAMLF